MNKQKTPWTLYIDQGQGPKIHAERSGPEPLKAIAKQLHDLANEPEHLSYYIYDQHGRLQFKSAHNTSWRMRWKRLSGMQQLINQVA